MVNTSPAAERVIAILNLFAEHADQTFSLTQVTKALRLNRATCHSLLMTLADGEFLYRNPDKTFVLGPAAVALGRASLRHFSPLEAARQEMRLLADELDVVVAAMQIEGDYIVVGERAASRTHLRWAPPPGQRYRVQGFNAGCLVFASPGQLPRLLEELEPETATAQKPRLREQADFFQTHGFVLALVPGGKSLNPEEEGVEGLSRRVEYFGGSLDLDGDYALLSIAAPVLNAHGQTLFALTVYGFSRTYKGEEVAAIGRRLREACARLTRYAAGKARLDFPGLEAESPASGSVANA